MTLYDFFDRISILHLPEQSERFRSISGELLDLGFEITYPKVHVHYSSHPPEAHGFPSHGAYGNFRSHLAVLRAALKEQVSTVWVLEDDAIFSRCMLRNQEVIAEYLQRADWDFCFFGHSLKPRTQPRGFMAVPSHVEFLWSHCYAVRAQILPRVVEYLEQSMSLPEGHPMGGKIYIDAAFNLFRRFNPEIRSLAAVPALCMQKGCVSSLSGPRWYDRVRPTRPLISIVRRSRDYWWKISSGNGTFAQRWGMVDLESSASPARSDAALEPSQQLRRPKRRAARAGMLY